MSDSTNNADPGSADKALNRPVSRPVVRKGRGALTNLESRYLPTVSVAEDDGWNWLEKGEQQWGQGRLATSLYVDRTRTLISKNTSPDIPFSQSINPYKGCEHGCIYCFARPTHAYLDLSPGIDFETKIFRKSNARAHLLRELAKRNYQCSVIAMGTNTDPYQPYERSQGVTREILETLLELKHPVSIVTKSKLILRDLDILSALARLNLLHVNVSVTTLSNELKAKLEPRTAGPAARLRTIAELRAAGVPTGALIAPIIPFVNDAELEDLVTATAEAGAQVVKYILLRLPLEVAPLMQEWLAEHYPQRAKRVLEAIKSARRGKHYRAEWHTRMVGEGPVADLIKRRFAKAVRDAGLQDADLPPICTDLFEPPAVPKPGQDRQLSLFD